MLNRAYTSNLKPALFSCLNLYPRNHWTTSFPFLLLFKSVSFNSILIHLYLTFLSFFKLCLHHLSNVSLFLYYYPFLLSSFYYLSTLSISHCTYMQTNTYRHPKVCLKMPQSLINLLPREIQLIYHCTVERGKRKYVYNQSPAVQAKL